VIVLVGFMGAGKTTVGRLLSGQLGLPFIDADAVIEERAGRPVPQIFADHGEQAFRVVEHETIAGLLNGRPAVLALGGGAVEDTRTRRLLLAVDVVYLHIHYDGALARVGGDDGRPMLRRPDLPALYARRLAAYQAVATHTVPTDDREPADVCRDIVGRLGSAVRPRTG
jgi:shikimate kinase